MDGCVSSIASGAPLSDEHEQCARRILARVCEDLLGQFPTTAAEDEALLEKILLDDSDQLSDHRRLQCVRSRLSRKRCLAAGLERARAASVR